MKRLCLVLAACSSSSSSSSTTPTPEPTDWCARIVAGTASSDPEAIGLANAHFTYRYFGMAPRDQVDAPLVQALAGDAIDLVGYANTAVDACALDAGTAALGPAAVTTHGGIAWVSPGTGDLAIPDDAQAIALDLRGLPDDPALAAALASATAAVLATPVPRPAEQTTEYSGHPDSFELRELGLTAADDPYSTSVAAQTYDAWPGSGARERPVAVITDVAMPPAAAALALALRAAGRAELVGHSVVAKVAEASWRPVAGRGLAIRDALLEVGGAPLPDEIAADVRTDDPERELASATDIVAPGPVTGQATRAAPRALTFFDWPPAGALSRGALSAGLAVAYGTTRGFFRIYDTWQSGIDTAYLAGLAELATPVTTRVAALAIMQRFSAALNDAHVGVQDLAPDATSQEFVGSIPVDFDVLGGAPVARSSGVDAIHPGDTLVAVDAMPVADFLAPYGERVSAATPLNHAVATASYAVVFTHATRDFTLRAVDGSERTVTVAAGTGYPPFGPQRASGLLTDLGASDVYYININGYGGPQYTSDQLLAQLDAAANATGLVIDGRGYPGVDTTELVARIVGGPAVSPHYGVPMWADASTTSLDDESETLPGPSGTPYTKPVTVLVGPWTQSAAENLVMIMMQRPDLKVVGRQTSGSNGNITSVVMPGGFGMSFTGMQVRYADGSPFHGVGIHLTSMSNPTAADFAAGTDRELLDGIAAVRGQ